MSLRLHERGRLCSRWFCIGGEAGHMEGVGGGMMRCRSL